MNRTVERKVPAHAVPGAGAVGIRIQVKTRNRLLSIARPYLYILPTFFFLFIFTHYPILKTFYLSLFKWNLATP